MKCLTEDTIIDFLQGLLTKEQEQTIEQHLDQCEACRLLIGELSKIQSLPVWKFAAPRLQTHSLANPTVDEPHRSGLIAETPWLVPETMVDHFRILHLIGRGGMGEVYLARDTKLGRKVAIKVIHAPAIGKQQDINRFLFEARATARCNHQHIVTIYHVGEYQGLLYLALEYLDGQTLRKRMLEERLSIYECLRIGHAIASALSAAHNNYILHRDLKPENIILPKDGRLRVLDFGLAKCLSTNDESPLPALAQHHDAPFISFDVYQSKGKGIRGTPAYMAPEQWNDGEVSPATDVWALGMMLYEILSDGLPFPLTPLALLKERVTSPEPVPLLDEIPGEFPEVVDWIHRCLQKTPQQRPSAAEVAQGLARLLDQHRGSLSSEENPFRGLMPFTEKQSGLFFGREDEIAASLARLREQVILPIVGPSGSGKSSLVQAGIIPRLKEQKRWIVLEVRPGRQPLHQLLTRLSIGESHRTDSGTSSFTELAAKLASSMDWIHVFIQQQGMTVTAQDLNAYAELLSQWPYLLNLLLHQIAERTKSHILLFIDQLEEIFTLTEKNDLEIRQSEQPETRKAFLKAISTAADDPQKNVRVVFTLREDFLGHLAQELEEWEEIGQLMLVGTPSVKVLEKVITQPLQALGYTFDDPALVSEMVESLQNEPTSLPMLEFTASLLWEKRDVKRRCLCRSVYEEMNGVAGALAKHADSVLEKFTPPQLRVAHHLLLRLVTPDKTRKVLSRDMALDGLGPEAPWILEQFTLARLISLHKVYRHERIDIECELSHESLIQTWQQLARWIDESRAELRLLTEVNQAAELWDKRGHRMVEAWHGDLLYEARHLLHSSSTPLPEKTRHFLETGLKRERQLLRRKRIIWGASILVLVGVTLASLIVAWIIAEQRQKERIQWAETQLEGARAAVSREHWIEARAKLRGSLEVQDSVALRTLWWQISQSPIMWQGKLGSCSLGVSFSPDNHRLAIANADHNIYVMDLHSFSIRLLRGHEDQVLVVTFSPDGKYLASADYGGNIRLWNLTSGQTIATITGYNKSADLSSNIKFSPDNKYIAYGQADHSIGLRNISNSSSGQQKRMVLRGHVAQINIVTFSPDGHYLASGGKDGTIHIWDLRMGKLAQTLPSQQEGIIELSYNEQGTQLFSVGNDNTFRTWDIRSGTELKNKQLPLIQSTQAAINPKIHRVAYNSRDQHIRILDVNSRAEIRNFAGKAVGLHGLSFSDDGKFLAATYYDNQVILWDTATRSEINPLTRHEGPIITLDLSPDGTTVVTGGMDHALRLWNTQTGRLRKVLLGHTNVIVSLSFSPDNQLIASSGRDQTIRFWDPQSGSTLKVIADLPGTNWVMTFNPDGQILATQGKNEFSISLRETKSKKIKTTMTGHTARVLAVHFSADGQRMVSSSNDQTIRLWEVATGRCLKTFTGHSDYVKGVKFTPDEKHLVSGSLDQTIRYWDLATGTHRILTSSLGRIYNIDLSPDGQWIGAASSDETAHLINLTNRQQITLRGHTGEVNAIRFSKDNQQVFTVSDDGTVRSWEVTSGKPIWHAPLMRSSPPEIYTHQGWLQLEPTNHQPGLEQKLKWRQAIAQRARHTAEDASGQILCLYSYNDELELWHTASDRLLTHQVISGLKQLIAMPGGCLMLANGSIMELRQSAETKSLMQKVSLVEADQNDLLAVSGKKIFTLSSTGKVKATYEADIGISAIRRIGKWVVIGYKDGNIELQSLKPTEPKPNFIFESIPNVPVVKMIEGPMGTLIAGYTNGTIGMWSLENGASLLQIKLHGPAIHLLYKNNKLYCATELGDYQVVDLSVFQLNYCELLKKVWQQVPIIWEKGLPIARQPPRDHPCYKVANNKVR